MTSSSDFHPDWASPPGHTIKDVLAVQKLDLDDFCLRAGLARSAIDLLLCGELPIDDGLAGRLSATLGTSKSFWINREALYRQRLSDQDSEHVFESQREFLKQLPLADMKKYGWLAPFPKAANDDSALDFFEDDAGDWRENGLLVWCRCRLRTNTIRLSS